MKVLLTAAIAAGVLCANISGALALDTSAASKASACTPPLASIILSAESRLTIQTSADVAANMHLTGAYPHKLILEKPGYAGSATIALFALGGKEIFAVTEGDVLRSSEKTTFVYLPGGSVCPNGAPPLPMEPKSSALTPRA